MYNAKCINIVILLRTGNNVILFIDFHIIVKQHVTLGYPVSCETSVLLLG